MKIFSYFAFLLILQSNLAQAGLFFKEEWEKADCPKKHSLAWCLADYQGRSKGIFDMPEDKFLAKLKEAGIVDENHFGDFLHSSLGVGVSLGNFAMGNLFGGSVFLLSALMPSPEDHFKIDPYIVFFDDKDLTRSEKQVAIEFSATLSNAVKRSLSTLPKEATVTEINNRAYKIEMPDTKCIDKFDCVLGFYSPAPNQEHWFPFAKKENLPVYLGGNSVYSAATGANEGIGWRIPKGINVATLAKSISENLPANMYMFIPAGYLGGNPFPMFLHKGKALFFVKPKEADPVPLMPHVAARAEATHKVGIDSISECERC